MTREQFEAHASDPCRGCGAPVALETDKVNPNRVQVICSNALCKKRRQPWDLIYFVKCSEKKRRVPYPPDDALSEVWERNGNICWCCGASRAFLVFVGINLERHHPFEYAKTGHAGGVIPVCQPCHEVITQRQREVRRWNRRLEQLYGESVSQRSAGVPPSRVSPDPVRAERETPVGAVEGFSDDDAHG